MQAGIYGDEFGTLQVGDFGEPLDATSASASVPSAEAIQLALKAVIEAGLASEDVDLVPVPAPCSSVCVHSAPTKADLEPLLGRQIRALNIDLVSKLLLCRGRLVQSLIDTGIGQYLEFHALHRVCFAHHGVGPPLQAKPVPCSKQDVFRVRVSLAVGHCSRHSPTRATPHPHQSSDLSLLEKRALMKFMQFCMDLSWVRAGVHARGAEGWG